MRRCRACQRNFPAELVCPFESGTVGKGVAEVIQICPLCAYERMNATRGLPPDTPPPESAPIARRKYFEALDYVLRKRGANRQ